ncbi:MAG: SGNH/GDSL hydrolase family protein [Solirubrobacteraceae bacterium]
MSRLRLMLVCGSLALAGCGAGDEPDATTTGPGRPTSGLRYGVIGDSYSNGEALGIQFAWPTLLAQRLGLDVVVNPAVSGYSSANALEEELPQFRAAKPEVASLMIGTNDLVQGVPASTFHLRFRRLLRAMVEIVGGPRRVLVVTTPDFSFKPAAAQFGDPAEISRGVTAVNRIVRQEAAAQKVRVVSITAVSRDAQDSAPDGLHPSARELRAWTDVIEPVAREAWAGLR